LETELRHSAHCGSILAQRALRHYRGIDAPEWVRANVYVRPIAYKSAERVGVIPDEQDAFALIALPFGDYLRAKKGSMRV
jgi:branched-subunit amino acid aminotransferase/4-amino-4-deoxychorismate lyase